MEYKTYNPFSEGATVQYKEPGKAARQSRVSVAAILLSILKRIVIILLLLIPISIPILTIVLFIIS